MKSHTGHGDRGDGPHLAPRRAQRRPVGLARAHRRHRRAPAGTTFVSAPGTDWACTEVSGAVTCTRVRGARRGQLGADDRPRRRGRPVGRAVGPGEPRERRRAGHRPEAGQQHRHRPGRRGRPTRTSRSPRRRPAPTPSGPAARRSSPSRSPTRARRRPTPSSCPTRCPSGSCRSRRRGRLDLLGTGRPGRRLRPRRAAAGRSDHHRRDGRRRDRRARRHDAHEHRAGSRPRPRATSPATTPPPPRSTSSPRRTSSSPRPTPRRTTRLAAGHARSSTTSPCATTARPTRSPTSRSSTRCPHELSFVSSTGPWTCSGRGPGRDVRPRRRCRPRRRRGRTRALDHRARRGGRRRGHLHQLRHGLVADDRPEARATTPTPTT